MIALAKTAGIGALSESLPAIRAELIAQITWANLSAVCIAVAIVVAMGEPKSIGGNASYLLLLWAGIRIAPKSIGNIKLLAILAIIPVSAAIAVPLTMWSGREIGATGVLAVLTISLFPLCFIENAQRVFYALIPFWYLEAALMAKQWFMDDISRVGGFAQNQNAASAFLLLGIIFLATNPRLKWFSIPLIAALPFGGSRWVAVVAALTFALIFLSQHINWKYLAVGAAVTVICVVGLERSDVGLAYRIAGGDGEFLNATEETTRTIRYDAGWRLTAGVNLADPWILVPLGFLRDSQLHNVPIRMAVETGLLSGLAWLGLSVYALGRRPRLTQAWWMMLALALLSVMYYHTWIGPLGAFWWLLMAILAKDRPVTQRVI